MSDGEDEIQRFVERRPRSPEVGHDDDAEIAMREEDELTDEPPAQRRRLNDDPPLEQPLEGVQMFVLQGPGFDGGGGRGMLLQIVNDPAQMNAVQRMRNPPRDVTQIRTLPVNDFQELHDILTEFIDAFTSNSSTIRVSKNMELLHDLHQQGAAEVFALYLKRLVHRVTEAPQFNHRWLRVIHDFLFHCEESFIADRMLHPERGEHITHLQTIHLGCLALSLRGTKQRKDVLEILLNTRLRSMMYLRAAQQQISSLLAKSATIDFITDNDDFLMRVLAEAGDLAAFVRAGGLDEVLAQAEQDDIVEQVIISCFQEMDVDPNLISVRHSHSLTTVTPGAAYVLCGIARRSPEGRIFLAEYKDKVETAFVENADSIPCLIELLAHLAAGPTQLLPDTPWELASLVLRRRQDSGAETSRTERDNELYSRMLMYFFKHLDVQQGTDLVALLKGVDKFLSFEVNRDWTPYLNFFLHSDLFSNLHGAPCSAVEWLHSHPDVFYVNGILFRYFSGLDPAIITDDDLDLVQPALLKCLGFATDPVGTDTYKVSAASSVNVAALDFLLTCVARVPLPWRRSQFRLEISAVTRLHEACCAVSSRLVPWQIARLLCKFFDSGVSLDVSSILHASANAQTRPTDTLMLLKHLTSDGSNVHTTAVLSAIRNSLQACEGFEERTENLMMFCAAVPHGVLVNYDQLKELQLDMVHAMTVFPRRTAILNAGLEFFCLTGADDTLSSAFVKFLVASHPTRDDGNTESCGNLLHDFRRRFPWSGEFKHSVDAIFLSAGGLEAMLAYPSSESFNYLAHILSTPELYEAMPLAEQENVIFSAFRKFLTSPETDHQVALTCLDVILGHGDVQIGGLFSRLNAIDLFNVVFCLRANLSDTIAYALAMGLSNSPRRPVRELTPQEKADLLLSCLAHAPRLKWQTVNTVLLKLDQVCRTVPDPAWTFREWKPAVLFAIENSLATHYCDLNNLSTAAVALMTTVCPDEPIDDVFQRISSIREKSQHGVLMLIREVQHKLPNVDAATVLRIAELAMCSTSKDYVRSVASEFLMAALACENLFATVATHVVAKATDSTWQLRDLDRLLVAIHKRSPSLFWESGMTLQCLMNAFADSLHAGSVSECCCLLINFKVLSSSQQYSEMVQELGTYCDQCLNTLNHIVGQRSDMRRRFANAVTAITELQTHLQRRSHRRIGKK